MNTFAVFNIGTLVDDCDISKLQSEVVSGDLVHLDLALFDVIGTKNDEDSVTPLLPTTKAVNENQELSGPWATTYRTIIVSPRKSCSVSIVVGLSVATVSSCEHTSRPQTKKNLTRVVIGASLVYNKSMGTKKGGIRSVAEGDELKVPYDFFVRKIAVAVSFGPG